MADIPISPYAQDQMMAEAWAEAKRLYSQRNSRYKQFQKTYFYDPIAFVHDCILWPPDKAPTPYQDETMADLVEHKRVSIRGPHNIGKTAEAAWLVLWFSLTRDGEDWKVPTTASAWRQLTKYLWPEIEKWSRLIDWVKVGRDPFDERTELLTRSLKLSTGEAFAVASDSHVYIEGAHADHLLYVFDEAKAIPNETWDAAEGAFAGAGSDTEHISEAYAFSISTPGPPIGRFYDIQTRKPGYEDWFPRHVKKDEAIKAGRMSVEWADQRKRAWGETSSLYKNRVLGEFAAQDEDAIIPLEWIEMAVERWKDWQEAGFPSGGFTGVGSDLGLGGEGSDKSIDALCYDRVKIRELRKTPRADPRTATMQSAGRIKGILDSQGGEAYIDVIGIGAGVVGRLAEQGYDNAYGFNSSEGTDHRDKHDEFGFVNKRASGWWIVREIFDPDSGEEVCIPDDAELIGELNAPTYTVQSNARIKVESKEDIRKRLKRSTDHADAVVYILSGPTLSKVPKAKVVDLGNL